MALRQERARARALTSYAADPETADTAAGILAAAMAARARIRAAKHALFLDRLGGGVDPRHIDVEQYEKATNPYEQAPVHTSVQQQQQQQQQQPAARRPQSALPLSTRPPSARLPPTKTPQKGSDDELAAAAQSVSDRIDRAVAEQIQKKAATHASRPASASGSASSVARPTSSASAAAGIGVEERHGREFDAYAAALANAEDRLFNPCGGAGLGAPSVEAAASPSARASGTGRAWSSVRAAAAGDASVAGAGGGSGTHRSHKALTKRENGSATDVLLQFGYQSESPIASGAFSQVVRARHLSTGKEVAVKTFQTRARGGKAAAALKDVRAELDALTRLQPSAHVHVANLVATFESEHELHAILEYCQGGSLQKHLHAQGHGMGLPELEAFKIACQVACALGHMHALGVAHRDVKPDNLIFADRTRAAVRLVDFGFASCHDGKRLRTVCGSPAYMAPELIANMPYLGPPVDVWALGALLFELLHNRTAFRGESMAQLHIRIRKGAHTPFGPEASSRAKKIIKKALTVEVQERADAMTIARNLHDSGIKVDAMPS
jgi:tRNA A-37 threonylcarbamoyl transferase component Bud32